MLIIPLTLDSMVDEIQCKHLLAVVLAHKMGREIRTEVSLSGVAALLGIGFGLKEGIAVKEEVPG